MGNGLSAFTGSVYFPLKFLFRCLAQLATACETYLDGLKAHAVFQSDVPWLRAKVYVGVSSQGWFEWQVFIDPSKYRHGVMVYNKGIIDIA